MKHEKINSTNIHSIAHDGSAMMEVRFACSRCKGKGCESCTSSGHTGTYRFDSVPAEIHARVLAGEPAEAGGKPSVGAAFNRLIRGKYVGGKE